MLQNCQNHINQWMSFGKAPSNQFCVKIFFITLPHTNSLHSTPLYRYFTDGRSYPHLMSEWLILNQNIDDSPGVIYINILLKSLLFA